MDKKLKDHIREWLKESDELKAEDFFYNCEIVSKYIDTAFALQGDKSTDIIEIIIYLPLKKFNNISLYSSELDAIELAVRQSSESYGAYVQNLDWQPYIPSEFTDKESQIRLKSITSILNQEYIESQVRSMNDSIIKQPHLAVGIAKELIETCCKYILSKRGITVLKKWDFLKLVKETNKVIESDFFDISHKNEIVNIATRKIVIGAAQIVHGVAELRNNFGSGHGHEPSFQQLNNPLVKLAVASASELAIFYLKIYNDEN